MSSIIESFAVASLVGVGVKLIIPGEVVKTLRATCFRGKGLARAGNSCRWDSPSEMIGDMLFREPFLDIVAESIRENASSLEEGYLDSVAVTFAPEVPVGWVTALPREQVNGAKLHLAKIGERARGMVVAVDDREHPAPLTNLIHLKVGFRSDFKSRSEVAVRILGMGIGPDLGTLEDDVAGPFRIDNEIEPRKVVFFQPHHAGGSTIVLLEP